MGAEDGNTPAMRSVETVADRRSLAMIAAITLFAAAVNALSIQTEMARDGEAGARIGWILELTSAAGILLLAPGIAWATRRVPLSSETWRWALPAYFGLSLLFSAAHIAIMVWLRKLAFDEYVFFSGAVWREPLYEYRKDLFTFILLALVISGNRQLEWLRREAAAAREDARSKHRLTLKCGGRTVWLDAPDVLWARAAGNYVEVRTATGEHLARATLAGVERLLAEAGAPVARVHRSYIVNREKICEAAPTGSGDLVLHIEGGGEIPASRRYRAAWEAT